MKRFIAGKVLTVSVNFGGETMADRTPSVQWGTARMRLITILKCCLSELLLQEWPQRLISHSLHNGVSRKEQASNT